jgi:RND family efflux transporter MFP subunit
MNKPRWMRPRYGLLAVGVVTAVAAAAFWVSHLSGNALQQGASSAPPKTEPTREELPVPVDVAHPATGSVAAALSASTTLESEQQADVLSKTDGLVRAVRVEEGVNVTRGQPLAELDDEERQLALAQARLKRDAATVELDRQTRAHQEGLNPQQDYDRAKSAFDLAEADVKSAELALTYTRIVAPFSGRVVERAVVQGRHVKPGEKLFTIASLHPLVAKVYLPEKDVVGLRIGQAADVVLQAAGGEKLTGRVVRIGPVVDVATGTVKVTVEVSGPGEVARPGSFVNVAIVTDVHRDVLLVPKSAVVRDDAANYLFVANGNRAHRRKVTLGYSRDGQIEIASGLGRGELVVVAGQGTLKDGARIEVRSTRS